MVNIKAIQNHIKSEVTSIVSSKLGIPSENVSTKFNNEGDLVVTINPKSIVANISCSVKVEVHE